MPSASSQAASSCAMESTKSLPADISRMNLEKPMLRPRLRQTCTGTCPGTSCPVSTQLSTNVKKLANLRNHSWFPCRMTCSCLDWMGHHRNTCQTQNWLNEVTLLGGKAS